ncbi:MAG: phage tail protein [Chloroflexi bacterium]|nr:MAG: phage tail protein [Chloroflexota bacterium]
MSDHPTGQSLRFRVKLDGGADLGNWSKCDGLAVEYEIVEYKEGGENAYIHRIPGRAKYQNIKLTRPLNQDTKKVTAWIASLRVAVERQTAEISALDSEGKAIATWNPVKWNGPSLDVGNNQVATESLELAHNGFLA